MRARKKFIAKFATDTQELHTGGRKHDSAYFRLRIAHKKIAYVNFLVKNVDQLIIVAALALPELKTGLIDRFLTLAHWSGKQAVIIFTKRDIVSAEAIAAAQAVYAGLPYQTYVVANPPAKIFAAEATALGRGDKVFIKLRREVFERKRSVIVGHSGVGKTALLRRVDPKYSGLVRTVSMFTRRGRHTTTRVHRHELGDGGEVFDLPGLKELAFTDVMRQDLKTCYPEFTALAAACTYRNCLHDHEPNCAVRAAVELGKLHNQRYRNYLQILATLEKA